MNLVSGLQSFGAVPFSHGALLPLLKDYRRPNDKIAEWLASGHLLSLKRGLYVLGPALSSAPVSLPLVANVLYGPSYVSSDFALGFYGLIPEGVRELTSVTPRRAKRFETPLGRFSYETQALPAYPVGVTMQADGAGHSFLMASPEKALCDKLMLTPNLAITGVSVLSSFLEDDLRLDMDAFQTMDKALLERIAQVGSKKPLLRMLCRLRERG